MTDRAVASILAASDRVGPWPGLAVAAAAAVRELSTRFGLDLWMVTYVDDDRQVVVASTGPWADLASPGLAFPWAQSFCWQMVNRVGPVAEPDVGRSAGFAPIAVGAQARVGAYLGVPLVSTEGRLFGTLCAIAGHVQPPSMAAVLEPAKFVGQMLSTIIAGEQQAADRSQDAATAYALAERDRPTGLRNRRGFEAALASEEQRSRRYGSPVSILSVEVDDLPGASPGAGSPCGPSSLLTCAAVMADAGRPGDVAARVDGREFGLLAVECDAISARAMTVGLRVGLRTAGLEAFVGGATRRPDEGLEETWRRAGEMRSRDGRRRRRGSRPGIGL